MKFNFNKLYNFIIVLLIIVPLVVVPVYISKNKFYFEHSYDIQNLESRIENEESFVMYFGNKSCPACKAFKTELINNNDFKALMKQKKASLGIVMIGYNGDRKGTGRYDGEEAFQDFYAKVGGISGTSDIGTPFFIFFKDGEFVKYVSGFVEGDEEGSFFAEMNEVYPKTESNNS